MITNSTSSICNTGIIHNFTQVKCSLEFFKDGTLIFFPESLLGDFDYNIQLPDTLFLSARRSRIEEIVIFTIFSLMGMLGPLFIIAEFCRVRNKRLKREKLDNMLVIRLDEVQQENKGDSI